MEIEIFTLCDFAQDNGGKLIIVGTFDSMQAKSFPVRHPACSIACRLRFSKKEFGPHTVTVRFIDSQNNELVQPLEAELMVEQPKIGEHATINLVINYNNIEFKNAGRYSFELSMDGEWKSGLPLQLSKI
ncbi:MAG TPA: hypothetical protein VFH07_10300 [Chitinophagaceae bacterium]|nr:hypothetical protein [Chitinophagaceae bacterium]